MTSRAFPEVLLAVVGWYTLHGYKFLNTLNDDCLEKLVHVRCLAVTYLENMLTEAPDTTSMPRLPPGLFARL